MRDFHVQFWITYFLEKSLFYAFTNISIQIRQRRNSMNILDVSFFIISSIIRMGKSTVYNNFQQFYVLGHPNIHTSHGNSVNQWVTKIEWIKEWPSGYACVCNGDIIKQMKLRKEAFIYMRSYCYTGCYWVRTNNNGELYNNHRFVKCITR